jgi:hypothetical protein
LLRLREQSVGNTYGCLHIACCITKEKADVG